jgi:predicted O-methyltransferase YrrM
VSHPSDGFTTIVHPEVQALLAGLAGPDDPILERLERYGAERHFPLIGRASGRWLELLTRAIGGRRVFEFGSGYGYSAFFFARAVGDGGAVIGSEKDAHELVAHRELFAGHPLAARIDLRLGSAFDVFAATDGEFDAVLIDIHKEGYVDALQVAVPRLRSGGLLLADNALWGGKVARAAAPDDDATRALQEFDRRLASDPRLLSAILPVGDGLAVGLKR